ncbi:hypothetical protein CUMW_025320 [Citrus unshiu]|nr:hypothetical protein CUMW_025320 [Citrus unshiu]
MKSSEKMNNAYVLNKFENMVCYPSLGIILRIYLHCTLSLYSSLSNLYLLARFSQKSGSFSAKWNQRRLICVAVLQDTDTWTSATSEILLREY